DRRRGKNLLQTETPQQPRIKAAVDFDYPQPFCARSLVSSGTATQGILPLSSSVFHDFRINDLVLSNPCVSNLVLNISLKVINLRPSSRLSEVCRMAPRIKFCLASPAAVRLSQSRA